MSDVSYNVEDGTPPPDPSPISEPAAPVAPAVAAAPPADDPDEADVQDVAGQKMVPYPALRAARDEARALKEKAAKFDEVSTWYAQHKPYVDFLQANPDLLKPRQAPAPAPAPTATPEQDEALVSLARTLDLYTPEGKPDAARAATIRNLVKSEAKTIAQEAVKPIAEMTTRERAQVNYQHALNVTMPNGQKPNPATLAAIWKNGDPNVLATADGAALAVMMAVGAEMMSGQPQTTPAPQPQPPGQPPVVTEPAGSRHVNRAPISEFEQRVMNIRGISPQKYAEYTKEFRAGQTNVLEDI
jgi:hypothetical protein